MFFHQDSELKQLFIHSVGNKTQDEFYSLSEKPFDLHKDELLHQLFKHYLLSPFIKVNEVYRLFHPSGDHTLNEVFQLATQFYDGRLDFKTFSQSIARYLYEVSNHPKIKRGEIYVAEIDNVQFEGESHRAIGIFKSENKNTFFTVSPLQEGFDVDFENQAVNIDSLDKGVIIINSEREEGFKILVIDQTSKADAIYWKDDFLQVTARNDSYQKTANIMKVYKDFVIEKIDETFEVGPSDKIELLNKATAYLNTHETFDLEEFGEEVIRNPQAMDLFRNQKEYFEDEYDMVIGESFDISDKAVKKIKSSFKNVIKLDKNFKINILGNKERIESGYDQEKGLNYYKLYFENEV